MTFFFSVLSFLSLLRLLLSLLPFPSASASSFSSSSTSLSSLLLSLSLLFLFPSFHFFLFISSLLFASDSADGVVTLKVRERGKFWFRPLRLPNQKEKEKSNSFESPRKTLFDLIQKLWPSKVTQKSWWSFLQRDDVIMTRHQRVMMTSSFAVFILSLVLLIVSNDDVIASHTASD